MKAFLILVCAFLGAFAAPLPTAPIAADLAGTETGNRSLVEAPQGKAAKLGGPARMKQAPASGDPCELFFDFVIESAGAWIPVLGGMGPHSGADSFYWAIDDRAVAYGGLTPLGAWGEVELPPLELAAGKHRMRLWTREPGFLVCRLHFAPGKEAPLKAIHLRPGEGTLQPGRASRAGATGVALAEGQKSGLDSAEGPPDLSLRFTTARPATWVLYATSAAPKEAFYYMMVSVDGDPPRKRVAVSPWKNPAQCREEIQKMRLGAGEHLLRFWLSEGQRLDAVEAVPFIPPPIPPEVAAWKPGITPPTERPRVLLSRESIPLVKARLTRGQNAPVWEKLRKEALLPFLFDPKRADLVGENPMLLAAVEKKAFLWVMEGNEAAGREALATMRRYLERVEFGNQLDICRKIGLVIYTASLVYDWCHALATAEDRVIYHEHLLRLAQEMEIGWPPFKQIVVNGHGGEAQVSRDLLSMGIALWGEDDEPYRLCAYRILEEMVPMHDWEYRSGWHNQGSAYGQYRFGWNLYAAWLFRRMAGRDIFSKDLAQVPYFWIYLLTPDGDILADGDNFLGGKSKLLDFTFFLAYTWGADGVLKGEYEREYPAGVGAWNPLLFLLLNDPSLEAAPSLASLPLARSFGPPHGNQLVHTGWNPGASSPDAVVLMKGAGIHFNNHQHADAGSFQIYYRGLLAADLGLYGYYGTPYDMNFNKRSVAHNTLLVVDPKEDAGPYKIDGGQRFVAGCPPNLPALGSGAWSNGGVLASGFGPSPRRPSFAQLKVDLAASYSNKVSAHTRRFVELNLGLQGRPAALIVLDRVSSADPSFRKTWQLNSYAKPETVDGQIMVHGQGRGLSGLLALKTLLPEAGNLETHFLGGDEANSVLGVKYQPPRPGPASTGWRTLLSPRRESREDVFLNVLQVMDDGLAPLPLEFRRESPLQFFVLADRIVGLSASEGNVEAPITVAVPEGAPSAKGKQWQVLLCDLKSGPWVVAAMGGRPAWNAEVLAGSGTIFWKAPPGNYLVKPGRKEGAPPLPSEEGLEVAPLTNESAGKAILDGKILKNVPVRREGVVWSLQAEPLLRELGAETESRGGELRISYQGERMTFRAGSRDIQIEGAVLTLPQAIVEKDGALFVADHSLAALAGRSLAREAETGSVLLTKRACKDSFRVIAIEASTEGDPQELFALLERGMTGPKGNAYWAGSGDGVTLTFILLRPRPIAAVAIAWANGNARKARFEIQTSLDGTRWVDAFRGESSGETLEPETYRFAPREAGVVRFIGHGNTVNAWNSLVSFKME
ncbi:MAG: discoidin domain-containing protein [Spirochaetes bacterium]|nr:discoidin domain-containing protein [Spirochaetota bacterium]